VQYIQNTINKVEIEKIKNNHKGMDVEGCQMTYLLRRWLRRKFESLMSAQIDSRGL